MHKFMQEPTNLIVFQKYSFHGGNYSFFQRGKWYFWIASNGLTKPQVMEANRLPLMSIKLHRTSTLVVIGRPWTKIWKLEIKEKKKKILFHFLFFHWYMQYKEERTVLGMIAIPVHQQALKLEWSWSMFEDPA